MGAGMADHPHTIDRWDDATGQNLWSSRLPAVRRLHGRAGDLRAAVKRWPKDKTTLRKSGAGH